VNDGQASIRGGSGFSYGAGSRVLMLVDEMPMISADASDIKWNYLPIENLEQVEVVKGASSVLYGSGALNGVVNLRTAFARSEPRTQATLFYGSYDAPRNVYKWWSGSSQTQRGFNFSHAQKIKNFDLVIGAHKFTDDGFRMFETESRDRFNTNLKYSFPKLRALSAGVNTNMMNTRGGLFFLWQNYDSAYIPQGRNIQRYNNNRMNIDPWVTWTGNGDSVRNYKISLRNRYFKTQNTNDKLQNSYAELYYSELQYSRNFLNGNVTAGFVRMEQMVLGDSIYGQHRGKNLAGYAQVMRRFFGRLTVTAGLRGEYYKIDSAETTGYLLNKPSGTKLPFQPVFRAGVNYHAAGNTYLRASFGQGYRFPSVAEKFVSTSVSTLKIFPNPSLQPERAFSAEVSVKQGFRVGGFRGYAELAGFYTRYTNMIGFVFDIYRPGGATGNLFTDLPWAGFKSQNVGAAEISGAELSLNGSGMLGPVKMTILSGFTCINPVQPGYNPLRDTLGLPGIKTLKYRSRQLFKADIQLDYKKWSVGYSARYQSKVENIDRRFVESVLQEYSGSTGINFSAIPSTFILPGFAENFGAFSKAFVVQDLRIAMQLSKVVRISFIVNNFGNVEYQSRPGDVRAPTLYTGQVLVKI
jgi:iron complex outermembrane receptor protein